MLLLDGASASLGTFSACYDMQVEAGERVALVGASGCGKSTLLGLVAGFVPCTGGDISWGGRSLLGVAPHRRPVTTLFQDHNLFAHLDVLRNIAVGLSPTARLDVAQETRVRDVLARVGLAGFESRMPPSLSGGQQQRVALARCLLRRRPLLLLDEPFSALDADLRAATLALTDELAREHGLTVLMVTHDRKDAAALDARLLRIDAGRIVVDPEQQRDLV